jgi:hypothetical protein
MIPQETIGKKKAKSKRVNGYDGTLNLDSSSPFIELQNDFNGFNRKSNNRIFI